MERKQETQKPHIRKQTATFVGMERETEKPRMRKQTAIASTTAFGMERETEKPLLERKGLSHTPTGSADFLHANACLAPHKNQLRGGGTAPHLGGDCLGRPPFPTGPRVPQMICVLHRRSCENEKVWALQGQARRASPL